MSKGPRMVGQANLGDPIKPYDCKHCKDARWIWTHHSGDGHGGLNGGAWDWLACHKCNNPIMWQRGGWTPRPGMFPTDKQIKEAQK